MVRNRFLELFFWTIWIQPTFTETQLDFKRSTALCGNSMNLKFNIVCIASTKMITFLVSAVYRLFDFSSRYRKLKMDIFSQSHLLQFFIKCNIVKRNSCMYYCKIQNNTVCVFLFYQNWPTWSIWPFWLTFIWTYNILCSVERQFILKRIYKMNDFFHIQKHCKSYLASPLKSNILKFCHYL